MGEGVKEEEEEEAEDEMEEEGTESFEGDVDISSVTLEECDGLRRGRLAVPFYKTTEREIFHQPNKYHGCHFPSLVPF